MSWKYAVGAGLSAARDLILPMAPPVQWIPHGHWPYDVRRALGRRSIGPVFDVGANVGQTARSLVKYFPDDPIYSFEPVTATFETLERRYGRQVRCVKAAFGAKPGTATITLHSDSELNTFCETSAELAGLRTGEEVVTIDTVDAFCAREGIGHIGLLKMDVQGWEIDVLRGAKKLVAKGAVHAVIAEVGFRSTSTDMQDFGAMNAYMEKAGFLFGGVYEQLRYGPRKSLVLFANALYVWPRQD